MISSRLQPLLPSTKSFLLFTTGLLVGIYHGELLEFSRHVYSDILFNPERGGYSLVLATDEAGFLQQGDKVYYRNQPVGRVKSIEFLDSQRLSVVCVLRKGVKIEGSTVGSIRSSSLFSDGSRYVQLAPLQAGSKGIPLADGDTIPARYEHGLLDWTLRDSVNVFQKIDFLYRHAHKADSLARRPCPDRP